MTINFQYTHLTKRSSILHKTPRLRYRRVTLQQNSADHNLRCFIGITMKLLWIRCLTACYPLPTSPPSAEKR